MRKNISIQHDIVANNKHIHIHLNGRATWRKYNTKENNNKQQQKTATTTKKQRNKQLQGNHLKARAAGADITEAESRCEADTPKLRKNIL